MELSIKAIFESTKKLSNLTNKQNRPLQFLLPCFKKLIDNNYSHEYNSYYISEKRLTILKKAHVYAIPAIGAVLIAVLAQISLPIGPVPFTSANFAIGLIATVFRPREAVLSVGLYLLSRCYRSSCLCRRWSWISCFDWSYCRLSLVLSCLFWTYLFSN